MTKVALIVFLLFLVLNVTAVMVQYPTCHGTGKVECPHCNGTGYVKPTITNLGSQAWTSEGAVVVRGIFKNKEDFGVYGRPIAEVETPSQTYTNASTRTYFPPQEQIIIILTIEGIEYNDYRYLSNQKYVRGRIIIEVEDIACPYCDGTGFVTGPDSGGALIDGEENEYEGEETEYEGEGSEYDGGWREREQDVPVSFPVDWTIVGVGVVAAVAIAAIVVVRRKKVTEKDLRILSPIEFQNWVVQRLSGKASSLRDSRIGIDAYTAEGQPIQIRQSDNIGRNVIENFASVMGQIKAKNGIIIAFSFADDAIRGIVRSRINYGVEIKKVTVKELIERRKII
jgi:hypothetical protein